MSRVIAFSRTYPAYHPRKGEPTYFVEKCIAGFPAYSGNDFIADKEHPHKDLFDLLPLSFENFNKKYHTIRAGNHWKAGDKFSPRVWGTDINPKNGKSGPYQSKQITIAPDIEIKKTWDIEFEENGYCFKTYNGIFTCGSVSVENQRICKIAANDGLNIVDFADWFFLSPEYKKTGKISAQIICWNDQINY